MLSVEGGHPVGLRRGKKKKNNNNNFSNFFSHTTITTKRGYSPHYETDHQLPETNRLTSSVFKERQHTQQLSPTRYCPASFK